MRRKALERRAGRDEIVEDRDLKSAEQRGRKALRREQLELHAGIGLEQLFEEPVARRDEQHAQRRAARDGREGFVIERQRVVGIEPRGEPA